MNMLVREGHPIETSDRIDDRIFALRTLQAKLNNPNATLDEYELAVKAILAEMIQQLVESVEY